MKNILIIMAMRSEASTFIKDLNLKEIEKTDPSFPFISYKGMLQDKHITLVLNGICKHHHVDNIGTVPAAVSTFSAIKNHSPDLIINAGTAGAFSSKGAEIGDVYCVSQTAYHDHRIEIPGFKEMGFFNMSHSKLVDQISKECRLKKANLSTGDSLDLPDMDLKNIHKNEATLKDMEGAAIAWVTNYYNLPAIFIKSVTDIIDGDKPTEEEFFENLELASNNLSKKLKEVVQTV